MQLSHPLVPILLIGLGAAAGSGRAATLLTFDELTTPEVLPGLNYASIPNGYGGLRWNNFGVLDGTLRPATEGYHAGMVSPRNVAFNLYANPASLSAGGSLFTLNSAYLTLALDVDTPLNIQVEGFRGTQVLYDHAYTVYRTGPTWVEFNYTGVDSVRFTSIPGQQFAMDNLVVTVPEPGTLGMSVLGALGVGAIWSRQRARRA